MKKKVTVPFPLNTSPKEVMLYEPYLTFELERQRVKILTNVFVTFSGFCMNSRGLVAASHHDYINQYNDYLQEASKYYHDVDEHPENLIILDDSRIYLVVHHPWFNYYHWICESIFRIWMVRKRLKQLVLVLPSYYRNFDFIMGSLEPFGITDIFFIPENKSLMVRNACIPELKRLCDSYNRTHLRQVRKFYVDYSAGKYPTALGKPERLYVSRQHASRRKVVNEEEILPVLLKYDFTIFHPEHFSFLEQVNIFSGVRYLIGEHGSGLTNLLFVGDGACFLELHKAETNELDHPSPLFWYMAHGLDIKYYHQLCDTEGVKDYFNGNYRVDPVQLELNLKTILGI